MFFSAQVVTVEHRATDVFVTRQTVTNRLDARGGRLGGHSNQLSEMVLLLLEFFIFG